MVAASPSSASEWPNTAASISAAANSEKLIIATVSLVLLSSMAARAPPAARWPSAGSVGAPCLVAQKPHVVNSKMKKPEEDRDEKEREKIKTKIKIKKEERTKKERRRKERRRKERSPRF